MQKNNAYTQRGQSWEGDFRGGAWPFSPISFQKSMAGGAKNWWLEGCQNALFVMGIQLMRSNLRLKIVPLYGPRYGLINFCTILVCKQFNYPYLNLN